MMQWDDAVALAERMQQGDDTHSLHYVVEAVAWGGQVMARVVVFDETWARMGVL